MLKHWFFRGLRTPVVLRGSRLLSFASAAILLTACATGGKKAETVPVIFPQPPEKARVQYLTSLQSQKDIPSARSTFADFVLGEEAISFVLAKPIVADFQDNKIYVADTVMNTVFIFDLNENSAYVLPGDRGIGKIRQPNNINFDNEGNIYIADKIRQAVLVYDRDGKFMNAWGRPGEVSPVDVVVGENELYVLDIEDNEIEVWSRKDGTLLRTIGRKGTGPGAFFKPTHLAMDPDGNLIVSDSLNFRVQRLSTSGESLGVFGTQGVALGQFAMPKGIDVDDAGRIYVVDARFPNIQIFNKDAELLLFFGGPGPDNGYISLPNGLNVVPWPDVPWLDGLLVPGFEPAYLALVVNQQDPAAVNLFAIHKSYEGAP